MTGVNNMASKGVEEISISETQDGKVLVKTSDESPKRKYDPNFKGPIEKRNCTDIVCCILFVLYMVGMIVIGVIGFVEGEPKRLLYATDSDGKVCGADLPDHPYLFFFDLTECITKGVGNPLKYVQEGFNCPTPQVCVKECPSYNEVGYTADLDKLICVDGITPTKDTQSDLIQSGKCAAYYIESKPVFYRCLPKLLADQITQLNLLDRSNHTVSGSDIDLGEQAVRVILELQSLGMRVLDELKAIYGWIIVAFILAMVLSLLYIVLCRWITFPVVIVTSVGLLVLIGFGCYEVFKKYKFLVDSGTSQDIVWKITTNLENFTRSKNTWLTLGIILVVLFLILLLLMCFLYSRLRIACALIAETSRATCSMMSTLFFPIVPWIFQFVWFGWFLVVLVYLSSNGTKEYQIVEPDSRYNMTNETHCDPKTFATQYPNTTASCYFQKYNVNANLLRMQIAHIFGWFWGSGFIIALGECTLAGAFASYYWARDKKRDTPNFPVLGAMWRAVSYHMGSLAFGAAIIAIVKLIRVTLEYIQRKVKEHVDNPFVNFLMKCLSCCFWCLEKCLRFLNKNAYIMIAIYGKNFCSSAREAFSLLIRNPVRLLTINGVTGFILFIGKLFVVGAIGVGSFFWFEKYDASRTTALNYSAVPIILCIIGSYIVTILFFNVYDMGIDTFFLSFLEDLERHDGSPEKPYFMTSSLQKIMGVANKPSETSPLNPNS